MATSKQSFVRAAEPQRSVSAQRDEEMHVKAPLTTMYVHTVPVPGLQPYTQTQPGALQDATVVPLFLPRMNSNQTPSLTLHLASTAALQQQGLGVPASSPRPKSVGKHVCPHCGKDCLKPSVLEKHLRCHTGERPYPCTTCGISFKTQSNLYKHKRTQAHARLSSESEKGTFSSQESTESSKDNCVSPRFEMHAEDSADVKRIDGVLPVVSMTNNQAGSADCKTESGKEWALHKAAMVGLSTTPALQDKLTSVSTIMELPCEVKNTFVAKQTSGLCGDGHTPVTPNRTPLQRQEALFSKPWESPMSRGKSQSHDSTDSGFSDSSEHHSSSSPGASLQDPSMESLVETAMEHQDPGASQAPSEMTPDDPNSKVSIQEKRKLEERISKLIYENSVLVEDKQLDHVRPRKTVLSKQGSIDLPVPYTYKDSFHFEIRSSKHISSSQKNDRGGAAIYSSVPAQHSTSLEHAPLTRSSSLPFTVGGRSTDGVINQNISRRCSAGYVYPTRSSDQLAPSHRPLVRQGAVDCLPSAEGSPVERSSISSLSSDGDSTDIGTEPSKGNYRKKSRKFDYTKWHTYKGGTFRKLYNTEKDCPLKTRKTTLGTEKTESLEIQISQQADNASSVSLSFTSCSVVCLPQTGDISLAQKPNQVISSYVLLQSSPMKKPMQEQQILNLQNDLKGPYTSSENSSVQGTELGGVDSETQHTDCHIPSERKKQRTGQDVQMLSISRIGQANTNLRGFVSQPLLSTSGTHDSIRVIPTEQSINMQNLHQQESYMHRFSNPRQFLSNTPSPAFCLINMSGTSGLPSGSTSSPTIPEAKTSFPPKYQLKIPCSTDGVSTSCSGSTLAHNTSSSVPAHKQSNETTAQFNPEISSPSSTQCQDASIVTTFEQSKHDALCATTSMPMLLVSCSGENEANASSKTQTQFQPNQPTSVSLVSPILPLPVQHQVSLLQSDCTTDALENQSTDLKAFTSSEHVPPVTSLNTMSTRSHCSESSEPIQIYSSATVSPTVKNHPASPVIITGKAPGPTVYTQSTVQENILNSTSKMDTGDFLSEGKVLLLNSSTQSQDTFYVRTADLQIVMQLISDEQLALIEPHIETPDFKTESSASYRIPSSTSSTNQTFLSQEVYKQSPKDDVTSVCGAQETVNIVEMETTENTVSKSCGTAYSERNTQNGSSLHPLNDKHDVTANSCPQWVKSMSHQHTKFLISADCSTNPTGQLCESHMIPESPQERKSAGFDIITESCYKQVAGDKLNDPDSVDNSCSRREYGKEPQNCSVHCVDLVISSDHTSVVTLSHDQTTTEMNEKYDIVTNQLPKNELKTLMCSNNTETINITEPEEPNKPGHITSSEDGERNQTERTTELRISTESQQMQKVLSSTLQPSQNKPCWAACAISDSTTRETRACGTGKLSCTHGVLGNETFCPGQTPTQYQIQQASGLGPRDFGNNSDKVKTYCPMLNRTSKCILEGSTKCGNVNTHHDNLDTFAGLGEGGTLESQRFPKDPGSEKKESVPKEPGSGGGEWESQADMNNTCQARKNNEKQDKRKEEAKSRVEHQTTTQLHSHPPQEIMNVLSSEPTHHDKFSISNNPAPSVCTNIVSQTCQSLGDCDNLSQARDDSKNEIFVKSTCQDTSQRETASSGSDQRVVLSSSDSSVANPKRTCRHLLVHPLLVNAMQKEVLKDPPTRSATTHWTYSKCTQAQVLSSQNKITHVLKHHCSSSKTEVVNTTIPSLSCAGPSSCETRSNPSQYMYSQALNTNQICPPATYSNPTETKSFYLGNNYMEHEDSNSSSDDEQKLVIELE